jgi:2-oxoglutarate dehydrogenase E2 component (dihydrolipoamide succinyltransferase)
MSIEIKVPAMGESVTEATVAKWLKNVGDAVKQDEPLVELETDKVNVEVPSPAAGVLDEIRVQNGTVNVGTVLGAVREGGAPAKKTEAKPAAPVAEAPKPAPKTEAPKPAPTAQPAKAAPPPLPSAARMAEEKSIDTSTVAGTGKRGQVTKGDVISALEAVAQSPRPVATRNEPRETNDREERVAMSRLRRTIAMRLKESQNTAAQLTTFNEVDMSAVMQLRAHHKDDFEKKHSVKLGFMGFFVRACIAALKEIPAVNAEIDGDDIIYKNHYDIGIAVSTDKGLVVPVVRDADAMSLADVERTIAEFAGRARTGKLKIEDLQGGTFTITNGGVFGSLMSTPILNTPQSGILGMHKIQERPVVVDGKIEIRPMMYLALSYDHRLVDGREAVTFVVRVKENLEDPERMLLDL